MHLVDISFTMGKRALGSNFKQQRLSGNNPGKKTVFMLQLLKIISFAETNELD